MQSPVKLVCFYDPADEKLWDQLKKHLKTLEQNDLFSIWDKRSIPGGANLIESINNQFAAASIVLLLLSADFLAKHEDIIQMVLWSKHEGALQIVPVLLRPCGWQNDGFSTFPILPENQKPITSWPDQDAALVSVAQAIYRLAISSTVSVDPPVDANVDSKNLATVSSSPQTKARTPRRFRFSWLLIVTFALIIGFVIPLHMFLSNPHITPTPTPTAIVSILPTEAPKLVPTVTTSTGTPTLMPTATNALPPTEVPAPIPTTINALPPTEVPVPIPTTINALLPTRAATPGPMPTSIVPPTGTPTFSDPLQDNSRGYQWPDNFNQPYGTCGFVTGKYYLITAPVGQHIGCNTGAQESIFGNFAYQITMTILDGMADMGPDGLAGAGPTFRVNPSNTGLLYKVSFDSMGNWYFGMYDDRIGPSGTSAMLPGALCAQPCSYFHTGLNQPNVLTVQVVGNNLDLWVNGHLIDACSDSTYPSAGFLGIQLESGTSSSSVAFSDLRVWGL